MIKKIIYSQEIFNLKAEGVGKEGGGREEEGETRDVIIGRKSQFTNRLGHVIEEPNSTPPTARPNNKRE